ncbi:unnamed protein product, partial [Oppiella nova]
SKLKAKLKQSDSGNNNAIKSSSSCSVGSVGGGSARPPAPPPRPLNVTISETNKANEFNESIATTKANNSPNTDDNHSSEYYVYQNDTKSLATDDKPLDALALPLVDTNVTQFDDKHGPNQRRDVSLDKCLNGNKKVSKTSYRIKNNLLRNTVNIGAHHEYMNMSPSDTESAKRDPLIDYDLVPSGIPVPINSLRATKKHALPKHSLKVVPEYEYDYDIPKCSQLGAKS